MVFLMQSECSMTLELLRLSHRLDAQEIWSMYPCEGHDLEMTVTHITIGGEV